MPVPDAACGDKARDGVLDWWNSFLSTVVRVFMQKKSVTVTDIRAAAF
ncbi:hypothetical protein [uncultured Bradyrhizobium sp.]|jgi:hypothetical protein|nr:hypothetical protein [uncultured Bradyrhizobium sp.]